MEIPKVFVIHYSKLTDRKKHLIEQFQRHGITNYEFVEKYDQGDEFKYTSENTFVHDYKPSMMSFMNKTFYVYQEIAENPDLSSALILEDDVVLSPNFPEALKKYISHLPEEYDMLFIGDGCNLHIESTQLHPGQYVYPKCLYPTAWGGDGATRCTDSYIVSKKCAKTLCHHLNQLTYRIHQPGDWWLNHVARQEQFQVYWAEPTIVTQGTQQGLWQSSHI